jgi:transposase
VNEELRNEIVRRWQGKTSQRRIAKDLGLARATVQSIIRRWEAERTGQQASGERAAERRPSQLDAYDEAIRQLLDRYPGMTAMRVFEELRRQGFTGRYTIVRERVKHWRPRPSREPVIRFETSPGLHYVKQSAM